MTYGATTPAGAMRVQVNGNSVELQADATLASLIGMRNPRPPFAVEVNKRLVRRTEFENTPLREGDVVEIVTLVGGG